MSTTTRTIWRVRNPEGLFSTGGVSPRFTKTGKAWTKRGALTAHLRRLDRWGRQKYRDCEIVEFEITERAAVVEGALEHLERLDDRTARERAKRAGREKRDRMSRLRAELARLENE